MLFHTTIPKSDIIGAVASGLCLIHCLATPFIFVAHTCSASCSSASPVWWSAIDYLFIGISFLAVYWSARTTSKHWVKYALWMSWVALLFVIINEKANWIHLVAGTIYIPALGLVVLHLYNRKYCQCTTESYCATA